MFRRFRIRLDMVSAVARRFVPRPAKKGTIAVMVGLVINLTITSCDSSPPPDPESPELIARQLVADFLSVPVTDTTLVSVTARQFNDSSLDCPEPGMSYLQVLTPGYRFIVEADGRRFDVRVSGGHGRICRRGKSGARGPASRSASPVAALVDRARQELALAIGADDAEISVLGIQPFDARTVVDGCAPECAADSQRCGYMIGLLHDGRRYDFHADEETITPCPPILAM